MTRRFGVPELLDATVRDQLDRLGGAPAGSAGISELVSAWPAAVGPGISRNAWPARVSRDGTLVVHVASSSWAFELSQLEHAVREKLGDLAPARLRFVVGPTPEPGGENVPEARRSVPSPSPETVRRAAEIAGEIEAVDLREAVARAAAASLSWAGSSAATTDPSDTIERA